MTDSAPLESMQRFADYRNTCKFLLKSGKEGIFIGCFFLLLAWLNFNQGVTDYLYFALGACELLIGLRNRYYPSATGVILDGLMLIILGVWNLSWQAIAVAQGAQPFWFNGFFGILVIVMGVRRTLRYPRVKKAFDDPPTEEQMAWFDEIIKEIKEADVAADADAVEFKSGFLWKGKRYGENVIFADKLDMETLIVDRRDIDWTDRGKALFGNHRNVRLRIGERSFPIADFAPDILARLEAWRNEGEPPAPTSDEDSPEADS